MNMKVAGTLGEYLKEQEQQKQLNKQKSNTPKKTEGKESQLTSECMSIGSKKVETWDPSLFEGLNPKQKKNLRKKLQRQKKKKDKYDDSQIVSNAQSESIIEGESVDQGNTGGIEKEIEDINIDIGQT